MSDSDKDASYKLVRTLVLSVCSALMLIGGLISFYGGDYNARRVDSVLISPKTLFSLNYLDVDPQSGKKLPFVFDSIKLISPKYPEGRVLSKERFMLLYSEMKGDETVAIVPPAVKKDFNERSNLVTIALYVKSKDTISVNPRAPQLFQELQISDVGSLYRLSPRSQESSWLYFRHSSGFSDIIDLLEE